VDSLLKLLVLQGPNLNLLGQRQPEIYGGATLADVEREMDDLAHTLGVTLEHFQSNLEGELVQRIQDAVSTKIDGIVVNAGGFTHTSVALRDAFLATDIPFVEVHISNLQAREPFRHESLLADLSKGVVMGFGVFGYLLALRGLIKQLREAV